MIKPSCYHLFILALLGFAFSACNDEVVNQKDTDIDLKKVENGNSLKPNIPDYLNADSIKLKASSLPYNYYFTPLEKVNNTYSRYSGYRSQSDAVRNSEDKLIEIQFNPESHEITMVHYFLRHPPSINPPLDYTRPMLEFIGMFDTQAKQQFERNSKYVFRYNPNGCDSNKYYNESRHFSIGIENNFDLVSKKEVEAKEAFIEASLMKL